MLPLKGKHHPGLICLLRSWRYSGFHVHAGPRIQPGEEGGLENLGCFIIRASFSQERTTYLSEESKVTYCCKDGKQEKVFDALEWLAAIGSYVPNETEQMVRYYGNYSNISRRKRGKLNLDEAIPCILRCLRRRLRGTGKTGPD
jgi:hypothetical protein